jgi:hypothetical protein
MKYTGMIYSYTVTQPEYECIVFDNIKVSYAKPEKKKKKKSPKIYRTMFDEI